MMSNLLRSWFNDFEVFYQFKLVLFCYFEPLVLPNEFYAIEFYHVGRNHEEFALTSLSLCWIGYFGYHRSTLICAENVVTRQELLLQVVLQKDARLPNFLRLPLLLSEPCVNQLLKFVYLLNSVFLNCLDLLMIYFVAVWYSIRSSWWIQITLCIEMFRFWFDFDWIDRIFLVWIWR